MNTEEKVLSLNKKLEQLKEKKMRNDIARENILKELKEKHGLNSIEEAEAELKKIDAKLELKKEELEAEYNEFVKRYGSKLGINPL